jgi:LPXTG-site transpeptidase (sortase) family protein
MSMVVLQGSDEETLRLGPGHIETTPLPGEAGNVAIAGHRDSFFRPLRNVRVGDDVLLETPEARVHYRVSSFRVVNSHDVSVIGPTKGAALTLVTCYPFWFIGNAPDRFIVRATRVEEPAGAVVAARASAPDDRPARSPRTTNSNPVVEAKPSGRTAEPVNVDRKARVREAVERFRLRYNAGLPQGGASPHAELMTFRFCDVSVASDSASATCNSSRGASPRSPVWVFKLARTGEDWNIKSVGTDF